eukprot:TRINITY_DN42373_c0_g1_i1.p1 TRINITY_DN42373_c0_g1~~TRINITY_DN42373_c0_g1_i1.p1  ORF type:complete len:287 (+),score=49.88 TRINITY_DN42373_c0_g1_i1:1259-2119(+)
MWIKKANPAESLGANSDTNYGGKSYTVREQIGKKYSCNQRVIQLALIYAIVTLTTNPEIPPGEHFGFTTLFLASKFQGENFPILLEKKKAHCSEEEVELFNFMEQAVVFDGLSGCLLYWTPADFIEILVIELQEQLKISIGLEIKRQAFAVSQLLMLNSSVVYSQGSYNIGMASFIIALKQYDEKKIAEILLNHIKDEAESIRKLIKETERELEEFEPSSKKKEDPIEGDSFLNNDENCLIPSGKGSLFTGDTLPDESGSTFFQNIQHQTEKNTSLTFGWRGEVEK